MSALIYSNSSIPSATPLAFIAYTVPPHRDQGDPMTTPIPEAAVEAAAEALREAWAVGGTRISNAKSVDMASTALTAARPHMEAGVLERTAKDYAYVFAVTAHKSPVYKWLRDRAATIAERTNDEPA